MASVDPPSLDYQSRIPDAAPRPPSRRGRGFLAVCATFLLPGLGHAIARRWRRAIAWFSIAVGLNALSLILFAKPAWMPALIVVLPIFLLLSLVSLIDAYLIG